LDPRIKGVWIQREHQNSDAKLAKVQKTIHKLYLFMSPRLDKVDDNQTVYSGYNSLSDPLQALFVHINKDDEFESDVDLYFKTLVVKHRRTGDDDLN